MTETAAGSGGGLRYASELATSEMVNQNTVATCVVACIRQLLIDSGIEVSERMLAEAVGILDGDGSTAESAARTLTELHPRLAYVGGCLPFEQLSVFFRRDPWVAFLRTDSGRVHSVIVDGFDGSLVRVRDPWGLTGPGTGNGVRATMELELFQSRWKTTFCNGVVPNRIK